MEKMRELRMQVQQNQREVGDFLKDLDSWTTDIKKKDESLKTMKPKEKAASAYPPVRSKGIVEKVKKKRENQEKKEERIKSSDYRKWDKLDVDAMLKQVDEDEKEMEEEIQLEVEKLDEARKAKVATEMKQKGNEHFKNSGYEAAIECYTTGMQADPSNPVFPANRAMAYLKLKKYAETEADCTLALSLDPTYTKAYLRRGTARVALAKLSSARKDFMDALKLEPGNGQASNEIKKLDEIENIGKKPKIKSSSEVRDTTMKKDPKYVYPIFIPPKLRSKKPLMRVGVQEIGYEEEKSKLNANIVDLDFIMKREKIDNSEMKENKTTKLKPKPIISVMTDSKQNSSSMNDIKMESKRLVEEMESENISSKLTNGVDTNVNAIGDNCHIDNTKSLTNKNSKGPASSKKVKESKSLERTGELEDAVQVILPPCPTTSFQFQAQVKKLMNVPGILYQYMLQISPSQIPGLLKEQLETETLMPVLNCFHTNCDGNEIVFDYLNQLTKVKRFEMTVLFMSDSEKKDVKSLFELLENTLPGKKVDLKLLSKKYGL
ncbi:RNA polymerase II-associated protein 3-like [Styela clava]